MTEIRGMTKACVRCAEGNAAAALVGLATAIGGLVLWRKLPPHAASLEAFRRVALDVAVLMALGGVLIVGLSFIGALRAFMVRRCGWRASRGWRRAARWAVIGAACVLAAAVFAHHVLISKTADISYLKTYWLDDDMMISLRYARNWVRGAGVVWNPGERPVEGYSNPLWMAMMTLPFLAGAAPELAAKYILEMNLVLLCGVLAAAYGVGRRFGLRPLGAGLALLLIALNRWVLYWATGGAETVLAALLVLLIARQLLRSAQPRAGGMASSAPRLGLGTGIMMGLLALVRADTILPAAWLLAIWLVLGSRDFAPLAGVIPTRRLRARLLAWLPAIILPAAHFIWRHGYYGAWFPNTYYLRVVDVPTRPMFGAFYVVTFVGVYGPMLLLAMGAVLAPARGGSGGAGAALGAVRRGLAALPLLMLAYCVYAGGDELPEFRFMAPYVPLAIIAAVHTAERMLKVRCGLIAPKMDVPFWGRPALRMAALIWLLGAANLQSLALPGMATDVVIERGEMERENVRIGLMLNKYTRPGALIAHSWAGAAPYFADRPALDILGKSDALIAHGKALAEDFQPGHNKYNIDYVYGRQPDVIVAGVPGSMAADPKVLAVSPARVAYPPLFKLLEAPQFAVKYRAQMVGAAISRDYHGIFVRAGSVLVDKPEDWTEPKPVY